MNKEHLFEIVILALATLLAPSLPIAVGSIRKSVRQRRERRRRQTDRPHPHEGLEPSSETGWVELSFVLLLSLSLSLSLDIYVVVRQAGQQGLSPQALVLLNDLTVFVAVLQTMAIAFLAALPMIRRKYQALMKSLNEGRVEQVAMREMLQAGLKELGTRLDNFSAAHAKIQRSLVTRDKALLMLITKVRDEQAQAYDELKTAHEGQVRAAAEQTKAYQELATAYDGQAKAYEELFRQNSAANLTLKSLTTQSQESLPDRKVALRPGRGASR